MQLWHAKFQCLREQDSSCLLEELEIIIKHMAAWWKTSLSIRCCRYHHHCWMCIERDIRNGRHIIICKWPKLVNVVNCIATIANYKKFYVELR